MHTAKRLSEAHTNRHTSEVPKLIDHIKFLWISWKKKSVCFSWSIHNNKFFWNFCQTLLPTGASSMEVLKITHSKLHVYFCTSTSKRAVYFSFVNIFTSKLKKKKLKKWETVYTKSSSVESMKPRNSFKIFLLFFFSSIYKNPQSIFCFAIKHNSKMDKRERERERRRS